MQYTRNELDLSQGTYRVRGDVIDIFPAESEREAVRVELFDDEIESLAAVRSADRRGLAQAPALTVYPSTHYVTPRERIIGAVDQIREELRDRLIELRAAGKLLEAQRLEQRTTFDLEMMMEMGYCAGIENYSRYLSGRSAGEPPPCLFDYLPKMRCWSSTRAIRPSRRSAACTAATGRARKRWSSTVSACLRRSTTGRCDSTNGRARAADDLRLRDARALRACNVRGRSSSRSCGRPGSSIRRSRSVRCERRSTTCCPRSTARRAHERVLITTLTKRMAEDLTEYLHEHGVRVRYLHSDIETVERVEIIRDLRLGKFDVLVGINLLREGLDMPEVSLVAILDADKEGFLRSEGSLIQTIGRAARHVQRPGHPLRGPGHGLDPARRRRDRPPPHKQLEYNARTASRRSRSARR